MLFRLLNLNEKDKHYKFDLGELVIPDWDVFFEGVAVANSGQIPRRLKIEQARVTIRDNVAKVKMTYIDNAFHDLSIVVDQFGVKSSGYSDDASKVWQKMMGDKFGQDYLDELNAVIQHTEI